jgi:hypothetical protein
MNAQTSIDKSGAYFLSQCKKPPEHLPSGRMHHLKPAITISHQTGAGAPQIAERLACLLQESELKGEQPWSVFNHQLIETALEEQQLPKQLAEKISEEKRFIVDEMIDDLFSLRPPSWVIVPQVVATILRLAKDGHAILVGHGATVVTAKLADVFHVRLTGSLSKRIEREQRLENLTPEAASNFVMTEDQKRNKFFKAHFKIRLDNELLYDLTINTDRVSNEDAAVLIFEGARRFYSGQNG